MSVNTKVTVPEGCSTIAVAPTIAPDAAEAKRSPTLARPARSDDASCSFSNLYEAQQLLDDWRQKRNRYQSNQNSRATGPPAGGTSRGGGKSRSAFDDLRQTQVHLRAYQQDRRHEHREGLRTPGRSGGCPFQARSRGALQKAFPG